MCPLGKLIDLAGTKGCIDLGVRLDDAVEIAIQTCRPRRHRTNVLVHTEREVLTLRERGLTNLADVRLWRGKGDTYLSSAQRTHER